MPRQTRRTTLPSTSIGASREVLFHDYGDPGARPKVYIQASLHADEIPGLLVAHHLRALLERAQDEGAIRGCITLVPYANPIGLDQWHNAKHMGRHEVLGGGNFNRNWPDLFTPLAERLDGELGPDEAANAAKIRAAMAEIVEALPVEREFEALRQALCREAHDADFVIDLHCDDESLLYIYLPAAHWPGCEDLSRDLGCRAALLSDESGGSSFDETFTLPWLKLAERFPEAAVPLGCLGTTVELRGQHDVDDETARADAAGLFRFLQRRGLIDGDPGPLPEALCEGTDLEACDTIRAPSAGVIAYRKPLGADVTAGEVIAELVDPAATDPAEARREIVTQADGLLLTRQLHKYATPGTCIAKVVGNTPLAYRKTGYLMED